MSSKNTKCYGNDVLLRQIKFAVIFCQAIWDGIQCERWIFYIWFHSSHKNPISIDIWASNCASEQTFLFNEVCGFGLFFFFFLFSSFAPRFLADRLLDNEQVHIWQICNVSIAMRRKRMLKSNLNIHFVRYISVALAHLERGKWSNNARI